MSISERRIHSRFLCAELVRVVWEDPAGDSPVQLLDAVLEDISAPGACVQLEEPLEVGSTVTLMIGDAAFGGHVAYSVFRDYGYFVGIRFSDETLWSSDTVIPEHLTSLDAIAHGTDAYI